MQIAVFDEAARLNRLSKLGDSLVKLNTVIDWETFRPLLQENIKRKSGKAGGRPPYDLVLMFKILVLQRLYNLSDEQTEYQINDRMSFMRFLKLGLEDRVPDAKTIWAFRDQLMKAGVIDQLFKLFQEKLLAEHLITRAGSIVDATFVDAPKQRNTREENASIKRGEVPEEWEQPQNKHKRAQKDTDARWTKKGNETHFGYKNHVKADADSKLIVEYETTSANVHDSQMLEALVSEEDNVLYADSAYAGEELVAKVMEKTAGKTELRICEKGTRNHPLTPAQKESNRIKAKRRSRIEHIFGFMTGSMKGITLRSIGIARAKFNIGLTNLVYNLCRYTTLRYPQPHKG